MDNENSLDSKGSSSDQRPYNSETVSYEDLKMLNFLPKSQISWTKNSVYVVGAGPGDPRLLTIKARMLLRQADLVAYDDLLHPKILSYTSGGCQLLPVGYRGMIHKQKIQDQHPLDNDLKNVGNELSPMGKHPLVHPALVEAVWAGLKVVRLKCGDPMIFGRSAEEEEELRRQGISCSYVPGITAALGAASYLGLPLTDRRHSSQVTFQTGPLSPGGQKKTIVIYMPRKNLKLICHDLLKEGWSPSTPVVFIASATIPTEMVAVGCLENLRPLESCLRSHLPGLVVIGETAGLCQHTFNLTDEKKIRYCEKKYRARAWKPNVSECLQGMRLLLLKSHGGRSRLGKKLSLMGADVVEFPLMSPVFLGVNIQEKSTFKKSLAEASAIIFRSCRDVKMFLASLGSIDLDVRSLSPDLFLVGMGQNVRKYLNKLGFNSSAISNLKTTGHPVNVLVPCSRGENLDRWFNEKFSDIGPGSAFLRKWPCYDYAKRVFRVNSPDPHLIVLPHSKALEAFLESLREGQYAGTAEACSSIRETGPPGDLLGFSWKEKPWAVFGPVLAQTTKENGVVGPCHVVRNIDDALQKIAHLWSLEKGLQNVEDESSKNLKNVHGATAQCDLQPNDKISRTPSNNDVGQIIVYTGQGKGKTTAALGLMNRALGQGLKVSVVQFIKGRWMTGERLIAADRFADVPFKVMGKGFTWESNDLCEDRVLAQRAWQEADRLIQGGQYDVIILDELTYVLLYGFVPIDTVEKSLKSRPNHVSVVITGRRAPDSLIQMADVVTEMQEVKHPFRQGQRAKRGLDY